jgi:hypothetical protein
VFYLLLTLGTLSSQMSTQVGGLPHPEWGQKEASLGGQPNENENDPSGGAPPAGEMIGNSGMVFVIPGVINLEGLSGSGVLFGGGVSQGYGWIHGQANDPQGSISVVQPYVGSFQTGHRHKVLIEYSPTVDLFNHGQWDGSVLHRAGIRGSDTLSERWGWTFSTYATNGLEYLRELDGLAIGQYPGWMTFSVPSNTMLLASGVTGLTFRRTLRQEFSFTLSDTYSYERHGRHYDAGSSRAQMTNYLTQNSNWHVYAQANRYSNQPGCTRVGAGAGLVWRANAATTLSLEGGPEYGSGRCFNHLSANFSGSLVQRFSPRTALDLTAARDLVEPYLLQSRWTDVFSAKLWLKTSQSTEAAIGSAYARSSDLPGEMVSRYRGLLFFSEFHWRLSDSFGLIGTYRYFKRDVGSIGFEDRHSWVFCSIVWHPVSRARRPS